MQPSRWSSATEDIPTGKNLILSASFEKEGQQTRYVATGMLSLFHGDKKVGEPRSRPSSARSPSPGPASTSAGTPAKPVTDDYPGESPYAFTGGTFNRIAVDVSGEPYIDLERRRQDDAQCRQ